MLFYKDYLRKHIFYNRMVSCAKEIHRLGPMDLKIYTPKKTHDCDSTADKIYRFLPKLSL
jgi:hypothetical protein